MLNHNEDGGTWSPTFSVLRRHLSFLKMIYLRMFFQYLDVVVVWSGSGLFNDNPSTILARPRLVPDFLMRVLNPAPVSVTAVGRAFPPHLPVRFPPSFQYHSNMAFLLWFLPLNVRKILQLKRFWCKALWNGVSPIVDAGFHLGIGIILLLPAWRSRPVAGQQKKSAKLLVSA